MADDVVDRFSSLQTRDERLDVFQRLLYTADLEERRCISAIILRRTDPLAVLPLEIALQIFQYLPLLCTWTLRSVSEGWLATLSSNDFVRSAILRWQTHDPSDAARPPALDRSDSIENEHLQMQAHRSRCHVGEKIISGVKTVEQPVSQNLPSWSNNLCLKGKRIGYICRHQRGGDALIVHDLLSGRTRHLQGRAHEKIWAVVLTTRLAAFVSNNDCLYISEHSRPMAQCARVSVTSSMICAVGGHDEVIVLAMTRLQQQLAWVSHFLLYDNRTKKSRSFSISSDIAHSGNQFAPSSLLVDSRREVIDLFHALPGIQTYLTGPRLSRVLRIVHVRFGFDGKRLYGDTCDGESVQVAGNGIRYDDYRLSGPCPTGARNEYRLVIYGNPSRMTGRCHAHLETLFDADIGELHSKQDFSKGKGKELDILWKGRLHQPSVPAGWQVEAFQMNETFLVILETAMHDDMEHRVRVLSFDPNVWPSEHAKDQAAIKKLLIDPQGSWNRFMSDSRVNRLAIRTRGGIGVEQSPERATGAVSSAEQFDIDTL